MRLMVIFLFFCGLGFANAQQMAEKFEPRFVALKSDKVNVRFGPTLEHDIAFTFSKSGLPVEITASHDNWRRIRDWEGVEGWVQQSLLSAQKRHVMVAKPKNTELVALFDKPNLEGKAQAQLEPFVLAQAKNCDKRACYISGNGFSGYVAQQHLWGVYRNEAF
jgi:SH3-like domain-containing protein